MGAFSAVPGAMRPGAIWPGQSLISVPSGPAVVFTYGTPYFEWEYGVPYTS